MAVELVVNGVTYNYPELTDEGWGPDATNWAVAINQSVLTKAGGLFSLTADVDFGPNFGLKSTYYKTRSANIATAGQFRLANSDVISFRNSGNSANLNFGAGSSDAIPSWNSIDLVNLSTAQTLSNKLQGSNLLPSVNNSFDIGSSSFKWKDGYFAGNLSVDGTLNVGSVTLSNLIVSGNTTLGDADTDTLTVNADIISNLRPDVTNTYDLGTSSNRWRDIYVSRDGYINRTIAGDGSLALPAYSFSSELTTGMWLNGAGSLNLSVAGSNYINLSGSRIGAALQIQEVDGSVTVPSYSFVSDTTTGIYRQSSNTIGFATNGILALSINGSQQSSFTGQALIISGSASNPGLAFSAESNTGWYRDSGASMSATVLGTPKLQISTELQSFAPVGIRSSQALKLFDSGNINYVGLNVPASVVSTYNVTFPTAAPASGTNLQYDGVNYIWAPAGSPALTSTTLTDNTTNGIVTTLVSANANTVFIKYSLKRGTNFQTGELKIVNDGTTPLIVDASLPIGDCGTTFSVDISGANLRLLYTTTSTGSNVSMKYTSESWPA